MLLYLRVGYQWLAIICSSHRDYSNSRSGGGCCSRLQRLFLGFWFYSLFVSQSSQLYLKILVRHDLVCLQDFEEYSLACTAYAWSIFGANCSWFAERNSNPIEKRTYQVQSGDKLRSRSDSWFQFCRCR